MTTKVTNPLADSTSAELHRPRFSAVVPRGLLRAPSILAAALALVPACAMQSGSDDDRDAQAEAIGSSTQALTAIASAPSMAFHWAPRHIQDIDKSYMSGKGDFLSRANYDGDFISTNNWDNLSMFNTPSFAYYGVSESTTHFFIY